MRLKAISKFSCRSHEYLVDEEFSIDDEKGRHLIAQKFAVEIPSETAGEETSAINSNPTVAAPIEDRDLEPARPVSTHTKKKKKR